MAPVTCGRRAPGGTTRGIVDGGAGPGGGPRAPPPNAAPGSPEAAPGSGYTRASDMSRVLILANEHVSRRMAGPAIRCYEFARELTALGHTVTLASPFP